MINLIILYLAMNCDHERNIFRKSVFGICLSNARNLKTLFLNHIRDFIIKSIFNFDFTLFDNQLPRLRVLILRDIYIIENKLISFIENSTKLKHLVIEYYYLKNYF